MGRSHRASFGRLAQLVAKRLSGRLHSVLSEHTGLQLPVRQVFVERFGIAWLPRWSPGVTKWRLTVLDE